MGSKEILEKGESFVMNGKKSVIATETRVVSQVHDGLHSFM